MVETLVLAVTLAVVASTTVCYLHVWAIRLRLRRLEVQLAEHDERLVREVKQRAAAASVAARQGKLNAVDEALIKHHTGADVVDYDQAPPWWSDLVRK